VDGDIFKSFFKSDFVLSFLISVVSNAELSNQEFKGQFENFVQARITLSMPNGEERSFAISEFFETKFGC
jgi:hypothetical protein